VQQWEYFEVLLDARRGLWLDANGESGELTHVEYGSGRLAEEHLFMAAVLQGLGAQGWELVGVVPHSAGEKLYLKRPTS
jgi:hypothetical protein